jgi:hypothetical protein
VFSTACDSTSITSTMSNGLFAKVRGEVITHFHAVTRKRHNMQNWLLGLPGRILCEQYPWWLFACSWLCSSLVSPFFGLDEFGLSMYGSCFLPERLSNHWQGLHRTFSKIRTQFDAVPLSDPSWNRIRPDTRLQIKGHKKSACPSRCMTFCTLTSKIC